MKGLKFRRQLPILPAMNYKEVASVLEELRLATDELFPEKPGVEFDLVAMEKTLTRREGAVNRLGGLIARVPEAFTPENLGEIQSVQWRGKKALEGLLKKRGQAISKSATNKQNQYFLETVRVGD